MKQLSIITLILLMLSSLAMATLQADQTSDGDVTGADFVLFADNWLSDSSDPESNYDADSDFDGDGYVDISDLMMLCSEWCWSACEGNEPPDANESIAVYVVRSTEVYIYLEAIDEGQPDPPGALTWQVTSLPAYSCLCDPNGSDPDYSDPNSNDPRIVLITSVPYTLTGDRVLYHSDPCSPGQETFNWSVSDGGSAPCGGSSDGTVTIQNNGPPHVEDACAVVTAYVTDWLQLEAVDNGLPVPPGRLTYVITSVPDVGDLYDPASGAGVIDACDLPYTLSNAGNLIKYSSDTTGSTIFTWIANDGGSWPSGGDSPTATYSITIDANPADCLSFNGQGFLTIPEDPCDPNCFDLVDGNVVALFFKTDRPFGTLLTKRDGGPGYELYISSGRLKVNLYDETGLAATARSDVRVDLGGWMSCTLGYRDYQKDPCDANDYVIMRLDFWDKDDIVDWSNCSVLLWTDTEIGNMYNDANTIVGMGVRSYRGEIDRIRFYEDVDAEGVSFAGIVLEDRDDVGNAFLSAPAAVRFMCDEGSGETITDEVTGYTAAISDEEDVLWHAWNWPFNESSVPMHYYRRR